MREERRLVWRVLRHWKEIADEGRFPRRDEIDPWMQGDDGANCVLIAVGWSIELSHFVVVGVNLAVVLCATDTLAGVLLSQVPRVVSARRGLLINGMATLRGAGIVLPQRTPAALGRRRYNRLCAGRDKLSLAASQRSTHDAGQFSSIADGTAERLATIGAVQVRDFSWLMHYEGQQQIK